MARRKPFPYRDATLGVVPEEHRPAVIAVAEFLHRNESIHMHEDVGETEPCAYCWLRAGKAYAAFIRAGFSLAHREQQDGGAS
jgi:hypothetical protein